MVRTFFTTLTLLAASGVWALAGPDDKDKPDQSPADRLKALQAECTKTRTEIVKEYRAAKTDEEREKVLERYYQVPQQFVGRIMELAEKNAKDPVAVDALAWVITNASASPQAEKAAAILVQEHLKSPRIGQLVQQAARGGPSTAAETLLRGVLAKSEDQEAQAQACYALAKLVASKAEMATQFKKAEGPAYQRAVATYGKDLVKAIREADAGQLSKEAEGLYEQVINKYGDVKGTRGTLAGTAKKDLFVLRNLAIGKTAPEIEGEDVEGKKFKLSDYRGKVVVLDFWGNW